MWGLVTQFGFALLGSGEGIFLFDDCFVTGVFDAASFDGIEFDVGLEFCGNIGFFINGLDWALGNTGRAVDTILGVDKDLVIDFVKTGHGTNFHAIGEFAPGAFAGNYMWHKNS